MWACLLAPLAFVLVGEDGVGLVQQEVQPGVRQPLLDMPTMTSHRPPTWPRPPGPTLTWQLWQPQSLDRHDDGQNTAPVWTVVGPGDGVSFRQRGAASPRPRLQPGRTASSPWETTSIRHQHSRHRGNWHRGNRHLLCPGREIWL